MVQHGDGCQCDGRDGERRIAQLHLAVRRAICAVLPAHHSDTYPHTNQRANSNEGAYMDTNEDADSDTDAFTYCNPDAKFHRDPDAKPHIYEDAYADRGNMDATADGIVESDGKPYTNSDGYAWACTRLL